MLEFDDAALIIGDPAMLIDRSSLHVYDLAEEWRKHTGLPFVFAFWAVRSDSAAWVENQSAHPRDKIDFLAAKREGVRHTGDLAGIYSAKLGLARGELISYLTENISYDLDDESIGGLKLYYKLARECGLIEEARGLVFCE
jgi:chorismate dehydratase